MAVPSSPPSERDPVGRIVLRHSAQPDAEGDYSVFPNQELDIGRSFVESELGIDDRSVSSHHLRIRCVMYEDDNRVPPMVYLRVLSRNAALVKRKNGDDSRSYFHVARNQGDILLNSGDIVQITPKISIEYQGLQTYSTPELNVIRKAEAKLFADRYKITDRVLGFGGYAAVHVAFDQATGKRVACKVISTLQVCMEQADHVLPDEFDDETLRNKRETTAREFDALKRLSHPNIVTLEKVISTPYNAYIFQEMITGGDLLSWIDKHRHLTEEQAANITRQLLEAVQYLHANHVVHRDIKPENILSRIYGDSENGAQPTAIQRMYTCVGTVGYVAPEMWHQKKKKKQQQQQDAGYSKAIDMWSVGCVTTTLLTGKPLFPDAYYGERLQTTTLSEYDACVDELERGEEWDRIGHRPKAFIRGCLATDEKLRLTATEALEMPWFTHPHYRAEFDAAYKRAIQDWKPRPQDIDLIEELDSTKVVEHVLWEEEQKQEANTSKHFGPGTQTAFTFNKPQPDPTKGRAEHFFASPVRVPTSSLQHPPRRPIPKPLTYAPLATNLREIVNFRAADSQFDMTTTDSALESMPLPPKTSGFERLSLAPTTRKAPRQSFR